MIVPTTALWYLSGIASFIYWWTKDSDFTADKIPLVLFVGIVGPLAFLLGWAIHGELGMTIIKRRSK